MTIRKVDRHDCRHESHSLIAISTPARIESTIHASASGLFYGRLAFALARGRLNKGIAIYPGSFDPPTNGHLDLIERGSKIFDELVVAILRNPEKSPLFSVPDRRSMLEAMTSGLDNVSGETFDGLTID